MPDFLLEIGCEEIPARMIAEARAELSAKVSALLLKERLVTSDRVKEESFIDAKGVVGKPVTVHITLLSSYMAFKSDTSKSFSTPRRIALFYPGILVAQQDTQEQLTGPAVKVAYKDGQPTPAAHAFARKAGVAVEQLEKITTAKGEYLAATVMNKGKPAHQVLAEFLPKEIAVIYWPKNMYWRTGKPERFVRPVRWIVALLDGEIITLEFAGIRAGNESRGHRILGPAKTAVASPGSYVETLRAAHVIASPEEREQRIRKALDAATRQVSGARWREDPELLKTVVNLTEWPSAILGNFDREFLSLPEEVLVTVMRDHQKYFAVEDASHKLAPHFLAVLNTQGDPEGMIRHGNERVLRARFNDARFFWDTDQKIPLRNRVEMLKHVTFQKDLGSYSDKCQRTQVLTARLAAWLAADDIRVDEERLVEAARLAKTDLTTELVKEFTEMQGVVGGLYAKAQGLAEDVADAIYDHYKPLSMEDTVPRNFEGALLSMADKADTIAGMFALGLIPSGSKDPFALRRQANGIIRILAEYKVPTYAYMNAYECQLPIKLSTLMAGARGGYDGTEPEQKFKLHRADFDKAVRSFFRERLEFYMRDVRGLSYDIVNATLAADDDDVVRALARALAIAKARSSDDFAAITTSFKRMKNILRQAQETGKRVAYPFSVERLQEDAEKELARQIPNLAYCVRDLGSLKAYDGVLWEISRLRPAIDTFFDKIMVMVEDEELRAQRLGLLQSLVNEVSRMADFSEIVTEGK